LERFCRIAVVFVGLVGLGLFGSFDPPPPPPQPARFRTKNTIVTHDAFFKKNRGIFTSHVRFPLTFLLYRGFMAEILSKNEIFASTTGYPKSTSTFTMKPPDPP
jgi:hypothetical protein